MAGEAVVLSFLNLVTVFPATTFVEKVCLCGTFKLHLRWGNTGRLLRIRIIEEIEVIPQNYLKHIEGTEGLYEIRVIFSGNIFRVFCFFDAGNLIVLLSGFQKKTDKTPKKEINRAVKQMAEYYKEKEKEK